MTQLPLPQPTIRWPYASFTCPITDCPWTHEQNVDPGPFSITVPHNPTFEDTLNALTRSDTLRNRWAEQTHQALNNHLAEQHNTTLATLTPPQPEPAPLPKGLLNLLDKNPPNSEGLQ